MTCLNCGKQMSQHYGLCMSCLAEVEEAAMQSRYDIINGAIESIDHEAREVYKKDPTRGRGRGPKWMDG